MDMIKVKIDRDSVCMADDCDGHQIVLEFEDNATLEALVEKIRETEYLASISGGKATWVLKCDDNLLAVIAQQWKRAEFLTSKEMRIKEILKDENSKMKFEYVLQVDPGFAYKKLKEIKAKGKRIRGSIRSVLGV